jgi:hypothetical protein
MSDIICSHCGTRQPAETEQGEAAVFCDNCGQSLSGSRPAEPDDAAVAGEAAPAGAQDTPPAGIDLGPMPDYLASAPGGATGLVECPNCQAANLAGAAFCDQCGQSLPAELPVKPAPPPPAAQQPPKETPTEPDRLAPATQLRQSEPAPAAVASTLMESPSTRPVMAVGRLVILASGAELAFPAGKPEVHVGREDPVSDIFPELDLAPHGGEAGGVSRRHARFWLEGGVVFVEDLGSTNFTFVNRQRVMPGLRQLVRHGDEVRFGRIVARFEGS